MKILGWKKLSWRRDLNPQPFDSIATLFSCITILKALSSHPMIQPTWAFSSGQCSGGPSPGKSGCRQAVWNTIPTFPEPERMSFIIVSLTFDSWQLPVAMLQSHIVVISTSDYLWEPYQLHLLWQFSVIQHFCQLLIFDDISVCLVTLIHLL